jgi:hypothetical protein
VQVLRWRSPPAARPASPLRAHAGGHSSAQELADDAHTAVQHVPPHGDRQRAPSPQHSTPKLLNSAIQRTASMDSLTYVISQHVGSPAMDAVNWTAAFTKLVRLPGRRHVKKGLAKRLLQQLLPLLPACGARQLSSVLYGMAKLQYCPPPVLEGVLGQLADRDWEQLEPPALCSMLWALSSMAASSHAGAVNAALKHHPQTVQLLALAMADAHGRAKPQELAATIWALAKLRAAGGAPAAAAADAAFAAWAPRGAAAAQGAGARPSLLSPLLERLAGQLRDPATTSQTVAMTLWSLGQLHGSSSGGAPTNGALTASGSVEAALARQPRLLGDLLARLLQLPVDGQAASMALHGLGKLAEAGAQSAAAAAVAGAVEARADVVGQLLGRCARRTGGCSPGSPRCSAAQIPCSAAQIPCSASAAVLAWGSEWREEGQQARAASLAARLAMPAPPHPPPLTFPTTPPTPQGPHLPALPPRRQHIHLHPHLPRAVQRPRRRRRKSLARRRRRPPGCRRPAGAAHAALPGPGGPGRR